MSLSRLTFLRRSLLTASPTAKKQTPLLLAHARQFSGTHSPDYQWKQLISMYKHAQQFYMGCGDRAQAALTAEYNKLVNFANNNPTFKDRLPERPINNDDGSFGIGSGLTAIAQRLNGKR